MTDPTAPQIDKPHLLLIYDPATQGFSTRIEGAIPHALLVNMLEVLKASFVQQQMMMAQAKQRETARKNIVLPNGPMPPFPSPGR